jgi:glutamate-5-semialdehyde dehydrogenase
VPVVPAGAIELLDSSTRDTVQELITARGLVDVVIPRGGTALISHVIENATVPVIETGAGNCHIFVDESADLDMASRIVLNAKTQRPSVCNAAEKLLVHASVASVFIPRMVRELTNAGVEVRGDDATLQLAPEVKPASEEDWSEEYLRLCMAIRVVSGVEHAIEHINRYSTKHSEAIITANEDHARRFLRLVDSATVY